MKPARSGMAFRLSAVAAALVGLPAPLAAQTVSVEPAGHLADGRLVQAFVLRSGNGLTARILSYGGIITDIRVPDRSGRSDNIVLSLADLGGYEKRANFSAIIGRYANRISGGGVTIDGRFHKLSTNAQGVISHGGPGGLSAQLWQARPFTGNGRAGVRLSYTSPDGSNGFPGKLATGVTYSVGADNTLRIDYRARSDKDTVVNLTNHAFFNLAGAGSGGTDGQWIRIFADRFTPVDARHLPTGEIASVAGTAFDLRHWANIGTRVRSADPQLRASHGFDHNFVLRPSRAALPVAACAYDPASGRALVVATSQPGLQFYTANGFDGSLLGGAGKMLRQGDGYALETQHFPDSPRHANFPSTLLRAGATFTSRTEFRFRTIGPKGPPVGAVVQRLDALGC